MELSVEAADAAVVGTRAANGVRRTTQRVGALPPAGSERCKLGGLHLCRQLNKRIALDLQVTERMVEEHRRKVYDKLGVDSAAGVATTLAALRADGVALADPA